MAAIYEELRDMFFNPKHADLLITCQDGASFRAHRIIISLYSPVLFTMITEGSDDRGQPISRIRLPDMHSDTVYMVLQFLYGGNYNDYETIGSFHSPSYVVFMTPKAINASLATIPCLRAGSISESTSIEDDYDEQELCDAETKDEDVDEHARSESCSGSRNGQVEDEDRDDQRIRTFQGHNLFDSLRVYCAATRFEILALKLLARDRFYRTAEKVLMFSPIDDNQEEASWLSHDDQRIYRSRLIEAIFKDFPQVVDELWQTVPRSDILMRAIPPILIATGYSNDVFRDHMRPLLEKNPDLALAVLECLRKPADSEDTDSEE